jgi:hypothetical protein
VNDLGKKKDKRAQQARQRKKKIFFVVVVSVMALLIAGGVTTYLLLVDEGGVLDNDGTGDDTPIDDDAPDDDTTNGGYNPVHAVGGSDEQYWTRYPSDHVSAGNPVSFPSWVDGYVGSKVLLILVHSQSCAPCIQQGEDMAAIMGEGKYQSSLTYLDLSSDGDDPRASDCFSVLDPEGEKNYIPLTIIIAKNPDGGYVWHSWEGVTGKDNLKTWLDDAIYYQSGGT